MTSALSNCTFHLAPISSTFSWAFSTFLKFHIYRWYLYWSFPCLVILMEPRSDRYSTSNFSGCKSFQESPFSFAPLAYSFCNKHQSLSKAFSYFKLTETWRKRNYWDSEIHNFKPKAFRLLLILALRINSELFSRSIVNMKHHWKPFLSELVLFDLIFCVKFEAGQLYFYFIYLLLNLRLSF